MTISDEGAKLRTEILNLRPDKRRRYPDDLRRRIVDWAERAKATGMSAQRCADMLGIKAGWRITCWQRAASRPEPQARLETKRVEGDVLAFVPVAVDPLEGQLVVVTPSGHRVEGLSFAQVRELLAVLP